MTAGSEETIDAQTVQAGDVLRVLPGETVPADGRVLTGVTSVDQAVMTGESIPVDKGPGDPVFSGTVNQFGAFDMRADRVGEDSSLQRMIRLVPVSYTHLFHKLFCGGVIRRAALVYKVTGDQHKIRLLVQFRRSCINLLQPFGRRTDGRAILSKTQMRVGNMQKIHDFQSNGFRCV